MAQLSFKDFIRSLGYGGTGLAQIVLDIASAYGLGEVSDAITDIVAGESNYKEGQLRKAYDKAIELYEEAYGKQPTTPDEIPMLKASEQWQKVKQRADELKNKTFVARDKINKAAKQAEQAYEDARDEYAKQVKRFNIDSAEFNKGVQVATLKAEQAINDAQNKSNLVSMYERNFY